MFTNAIIMSQQQQQCCIFGNRPQHDGDESRQFELPSRAGIRNQQQPAHQPGNLRSTQSKGNRRHCVYGEHSQCRRRNHRLQYRVPHTQTTVTAVSNLVRPQRFDHTLTDGFNQQRFTCSLLARSHKPGRQYVPLDHRIA